MTWKLTYSSYDAHTQMYFGTTNRLCNQAYSTGSTDFPCRSIHWPTVRTGTCHVKCTKRRCGTILSPISRVRSVVFCVIYSSKHHSRHPIVKTIKLSSCHVKAFDERTKWKVDLDQFITLSCCQYVGACVIFHSSIEN